MFANLLALHLFAVTLSSLLCRIWRFVIVWVFILLVTFHNELSVASVSWALNKFEFFHFYLFWFLVFSANLSSLFKSMMNIKVFSSFLFFILTITTLLRLNLSVFNPCRISWGSVLYYDFYWHNYTIFLFPF